MQAISDSARALTDSLSYINLRVYVDAVPLDAAVVKGTYTASVCGGTCFSIGNACAAEVELTLADMEQVLYGAALAVTWDVDGVEYPLFSGTVDSAKTSGGQTTVTAHDAMYLTGALAYTPSPAVLGACTAADVLADIAAQMGVMLDADTQTAASSVTLTEGVANLDSNTSRSAAAGAIAALLGGNAVISREGALAVKRYSATDFSAVGYADGAQPEDMDFRVDGLTFRRTDSSAAANEDGTQSEKAVTTVFIATGSAGGILVENKLATQALVNGAYSRLTGLTFRPGQFELPGGIEVEPGDLIQVDDLTVAAMTVRLSLDGGCKASITSLGRPEETGAVGQVNQALTALSAEVTQTKQLVTENAVITSANIGNLRATKASVADLTATNANLKNVTADVANISSLLAGSAGAGTLQAIHLTNANAVIDDAIITDAMIASLSAGKFTAGTIYTSLIKIASDEDENLLIDGSTIQIRDTNGTVRVQIGKDAAGDYSYYLWDASGNLLWNPTGVTEAGLNPGIIKDIAIADDAAISGYKLDIDSVVERANEHGGITVDASRVQIDNTTLAAAYKTVTTNVTKAQTTANSAVTAAGAAQTAADAAQSSIDNLQVGGRNLLRYSRTLPTSTSAGTDVYYITGAANSTTETVPDGAPLPNVEGNMTCFRAQMGSGNTAAGTGMIRQLVKLTVGETYTLSAWAYGLASVEHAGTVSATLRIQGGDTAVLYTNIPLPSFGRWYRVTKTFTVTADCLDENGYAQVRFGAVFDAGAYGAVRVGALKIEAGTMATDWSPAPEDVDSAIAAVTERTTTLETNLSVVQGQISAKVWQTDITNAVNPLGTKVTTLEDNYATVNQTVQGIQTQIGSLSTTVGNNYTALDNKITTLSLTADGLQTQVSAVKETVDNLQVGGRNLLRYSRTLPTSTSAGTDVYYITGAANSTTETVPDGAPLPNVEGNMTCFRAQMGSGNTAAGTGMIRQLVKLTVGETYTLSAWAYGLASVEHAGTVSATLRIQGGDTAVLYTNIPLPSFGRWYRVTKTFTVTADCLDADGYAQVRFGAVFDAGAYGAVRVGALKIEAGTMATDWTPAPEDVDSALENVTTFVTDNYSTLVQTVDGINTEVGGVQTTLTELGGAVAETAAALSETKTSLSQTAEDLTVAIQRATSTLAASSEVDAILDTLHKYFKFSATGLTIGDGSSAITLVLDNGIIKFQNAGTTFAYWSGDKNMFYTGDITVEVNQKAQFGDFAFLPREDGSLSFLKVTG